VKHCRHRCHLKRHTATKKGISCCSADSSADCASRV
jgi:hypothetical protein